VIILLTPTRGIITHNCVALSFEGRFEIKNTTQAKLQPQLAGVTRSASVSPNDRRFSSSGLNLTSEGIMWVVPVTSPMSWTFGLGHLRVYRSCVYRSFAGKLKWRRHPGESSQRSEEDLHRSVIEGQKLEASWPRPGEGCCEDTSMWQHLIGVPKGNCVT
jgi:hypothetical protein